MSTSPTVAAVVSVAAVMPPTFCCTKRLHLPWTACSCSALTCSGRSPASPTARRCSAQARAELGHAADHGAHDEGQQHAERGQPADQHHRGGQPARHAPLDQPFTAGASSAASSSAIATGMTIAGQVGDDLAEHPERRGHDEQAPSDGRRHPQTARHDFGGVVRIAPSFDGGPGPGQPWGPFRRRHGIGVPVPRSISRAKPCAGRACAARGRRPPGRRRARDGRRAPPRGRRRALRPARMP